MTRADRGSGFGIRGSGSTRQATLLLLAFCLGTPAPALAQTTAPPTRIVSLVPSVTETLFAMGAGSRVAAVSSYDNFPPGVEDLPRVGALFDPDVERILSLRPDLVIVYGSQTDLIARLGRASIPLYVYRHGSLADVTTGIRELGARFGMADAARTLAATIDRAFADIRVRLKGASRPRTMLVIGREPGSLRAINVSGGFGFLHDLLDLAGGANVFGDVKRESMLVSTETVLARKPEVIIELHYSEPPLPEALTRERATWQQLPGVPAVKAGRCTCCTAGNSSCQARASC
jgi:iron complex transport system substrate-binding protein